MSRFHSGTSDADDERFLCKLRLLTQGLPDHEPPAGMLDRVLADRASGARIILPVHDGEASRHARTRWLLAAAAALVASAGVALVSHRSAVSKHDMESIVSASSLIRIAAAAELPLRQEPLAPPLIRLDGRRLRMGRLEFEQRWTDSSGRQRTDARATFDVTPGMAGGVAAWRVVGIVTGNVGAFGERLEAETLFVARDDMRLLRRIVHASPYNRYSRINIEQLFRGDSVVGRMTAEDAGGSGVERLFARKLQGAFAPYVSETLAPLLLTTVRLAPGWKHSISLLGWAVRANDLSRSMVMAVTGDEIVTVPAGRFDCWRLELTIGTYHVAHWVRKSDGVGVLTRDEEKRATLGVREYMLTRE